MRVAFLLLLVPFLMRADLSRAKAEPNLEKRARLALENADGSLSAAKKAYSDGEMAKVETLLEEVAESADYALASLKETGKNPARAPRPFKNCELKTRELLRRLKALQEDMDVNDRPLAEKVRARVQKVHDVVLEGVMGGWK